MVYEVVYCTGEDIVVESYESQSKALERVRAIEHIGIKAWCRGVEENVSKIAR